MGEVLLGHDPGRLSIPARPGRFDRDGKRFLSQDSLGKAIEIAPKQLAGLGWIVCASKCSQTSQHQGRLL